MSGWRCPLLVVLSTTLLVAQIPIAEPAQGKLLSQLLDDQTKTDELKCDVQVIRPFLDFAFRYEAGYVIRCPLAQFRGEDMAIGSYLRVQPEGKEPIFLGEGFRMPSLPAAMRANYSWKRLHEDAEFSGVFAAGLGRYAVDLAVIDEHNRIFRKKWVVKISSRGGENKADLLIAPNTAASATVPPWHADQEQSGRHGPQLTVLLNAAPVYPNAQKLRAWDRAFLLSSLTSLLRGMQPSTVRLIAFNLEQQREVFHEETFGREQFPRLGEALRRLELGTVSYKNLQQQLGWADLLTGLVGQEARSGRSADAVVFLGPNVRNIAKIPKELIPCDNLNSRLYYLEFFAIPGYEFPDTIHQLTNSCHGNVYRMRSPVDLAEAINKLQTRIQP